MQRITKIETDGPIEKFEWCDPKVQPSWKRFGDGFATLRCMTHTGAGWLEVIGMEVSEGCGRTVSRQTMLNLDPKSARALRDWLVANVRD